MNYVKSSKRFLGSLLIILAVFLTFLIYSGPKSPIEAGFYLIPVSTALIGLHMLITINKRTKISQYIRLTFSLCTLISLLVLIFFGK